MSAREKFRVGQHVAVSPLGEEQGFRPRAMRTGVVAAFMQRQGVRERVWILWDGRKVAEPVPVDFVEATEP